MTRSLRYWLRLVTINALVTVLLLLVALGGLELYLRATIPGSSSVSLFEYTLATKRYKVMKSNVTVVAWGKEFRTNRHGFRDDDTEFPRKEPGSFRTIVLGDSFTASAGVDYDKIYTSLLERRLQRHYPKNEVINLAVGGYNIIQYDLVLREVGLSLDPDLVLVAVFPFNDLSSDTYRGGFDVASGKAQPVGTHPWHEDLYVYRAYLSRVVAKFSSVVARVHTVPNRQTQAAPPAAQPSVAEQDREENLAALRSLVALSRERGLEVVVALLPNTDDFTSQKTDFAPFEALCLQNQWPCVNLLHAFAASGMSPGSFRLNVLDPHPNEGYNRLVADSLAEYLAPVITAGRERRLSPIQTPSF